MNRLWMVVLGVLLSGCAADRMLVPAGQIALPEATLATEDDEVPANDRAAGAAERPVIERLTSPERVFDPPKRVDLSGRFPEDNKLTVAASGLPMRDFLNYVFAELLKVNYIVADGVPGLDNPVTLNTQQPISSRQLFRMTSDIIAQNNLSLVERDAVFFIGPADGRAGGDLVFGYGSKASDVPDVGGRILQVVPLRFGYTPTIESTIKQLVDIGFAEDAKQGALFLTGSRGAILRALDVVRLLDQPSVRASRVGIINLTYIGSREFIDQVATLLENEGIPAGTGRGDGKVVSFVPLDQLGAVAVFAASPEVLDRVEFWTRQIDKPSGGPSLRYFIYQPRNARASDLAESLSPLIGAGAQTSTPPVGNQSRDTRSAVAGQQAQAPGAPITGANAMRRDSAAGLQSEVARSVSGEGVTMSVDPRSNSLVFYTTGLRYEALLPMIRRLDIPPKQILLEATIAEVSLTGEFANGVEFAFTDKKLAGGTEGRLGGPTSGLVLTYVENLTDRARLRLQASDSRVNVLSKPIIVVRDGVSATISVGNDVPTVGATASDPIQSNRTITTVLYRKTGLTLTIVPNINAQGLVVMEISQTISNTVPGSSGVSGAPTFFDRSVNTQVVARSGQSVLLAGLISESGSETSDGIPWVRKLPVVGNAFRSDTKKREKTELVLLITPRVIDNPDEWDSVKRGLESALQYLQPVSGSQAAGSQNQTESSSASPAVKGAP